MKMNKQFLTILLLILVMFLFKYGQKQTFLEAAVIGENVVFSTDTDYGYPFNVYYNNRDTNPNCGGQLQKYSRQTVGYCTPSCESDTGAPPIEDLIGEGPTPYIMLDSSKPENKQTTYLYRDQTNNDLWICQYLPNWVDSPCAAGEWLAAKFVAQEEYVDTYPANHLAQQRVTCLGQEPTTTTIPETSTTSSSSTTTIPETSTTSSSSTTTIPETSTTTSSSTTTTIQTSSSSTSQGGSGGYTTITTTKYVVTQNQTTPTKTTTTAPKSNFVTMLIVLVAAIIIIKRKEIFKK